MRPTCKLPAATNEKLGLRLINFLHHIEIKIEGKAATLVGLRCLKKTTWKSLPTGEGAVQDERFHPIRPPPNEVMMEVPPN